MRSRSWVDWEQWALETFFLEPGSQGPIECVEVNDEHVLSFIESDDLNTAAMAFASGIGATSSVVGWLSGGTTPPRHGRPFCFRILIFACWVQVTRLRRSDERVFEDLLAGRLGLDSHPGVRGLPPMWTAVRGWLWDEHRIDLRLPALSYRWIGYTVDLSFPTWRDLQRLRGVRDAMALDEVDSRRLVAERIQQSGRIIRTPAFELKFAEWRRAVMIGDPAVSRLAFDRAWTRVASEKVGVADLRLLEDEYGGLRLEIAERGTRAAASEPFVAANGSRLASSIRRALRLGMVAFAPQGFGCWIATSTGSDAIMAMVRPDRVRLLLGHDAPGAPCVSPLGWPFLAPEIPPASAAPVGDEARGEVRRFDGIRVGNALLGRTPMTPRWFVEPGDTYSLVVEDEEVAPIRSGAVVGFPAGVWSGTVQLRSSAGRRDALRLSPQAPEHDPGSLRTFDTIKAEPEDGPLFDTTFVAGGPRASRHAKERSSPCRRMTALAEAVYARAAKGISMGDLVELTGRAVEGAADAPSPWDVLRAFVDGGWLEPGAVRRASARILFPRSPRLVPSLEEGRRFLLLDGMAGLASRDRISACADAANLDVKILGGLGPWSLPVVAIGPTTASSEADFADRARLPMVTDAPPVSPSSTRWAADWSTLGYDLVTHWMPSRARFEAEAPDEGGLLLSRRERDGMDRPPIYVVGDRNAGEVIASPVLAMLRHRERRGLVSFRHDGGRLVRSAPRAFLPAAWGRRLSMRALACAGPVQVDGRWTYAYPADRNAVAALDALCAVTGRSGRAFWGDTLAIARRRDIPSLVVAGRPQLNHRARPRSDR